jgi:hypothetical protein
MSLYFSHDAVDSAIDLPPAAFLNVSNGNAGALFSVLGLTLDYIGAITLPRARRALLLARNSTKPLPTRPEAKDGRHVMCGLDARRIEEMIDTFEALVDHAEENGATLIRWS